MSIPDLSRVPDGPSVDEPRAVRPAQFCLSTRRGAACKRNATGSDGLCTHHANAWAKRTIATVEQAIAERGFTLRYVAFCEDATTPGILGYYLGVTSHKRLEVKVSTLQTTGRRRLVKRNVRQLAAIMLHELKHVTQPEWDCGNRLVS